MELELKISIKPTDLDNCLQKIELLKTEGWRVDYRKDFMIKTRFETTITEIVFALKRNI